MCSLYSCTVCWKNNWGMIQVSGMQKKNWTGSHSAGMLMGSSADVGAFQSCYILRCNGTTYLCLLFMSSSWNRWKGWAGDGRWASNRAADYNDQARSTQSKCWTWKSLCFSRKFGARQRVVHRNKQRRKQLGGWLLLKTFQNWFQHQYYNSKFKPYYLCKLDF